LQTISPADHLNGAKTRTSYPINRLLLAHKI